MPPLDTGSVTQLRLVDPLNDRAELAPGDFQTVGAYLRAVRERHGHTVADLAAATRIRKAYLSAIEEGTYGVLPSRPFAIGYVRAYSAALELDGEALAERFKTEMPDASEPLRAPIGVKHEKPERRPLFFAVAVAVVLAVIGWNIVQRALTVESEPAPPPLPAPVATAPAPQGPIALGAPTPPPPEQTTPAPYVTPGLITQPADPNAPPAPAPAPPPASAAPPIFTSKTQPYGWAAGGPSVVLQARKPASLIVRGPAGEVYFARQLAVGDAYRAPIGRKLSAEVTDPSAFSIYVNDRLQGALLAPQTPLDKVAAEVVRSSPVAPRAPAPAPAAAAPGPTAASPAPASSSPAAP
jgi:cytoskeletal protein RodZ